MANRILHAVRHPSRTWRLLEPQIRGAFGDREFKRHALIGSGRSWQEKRDWQIAFLRGHGVTPSATFVDIGCGTLRGGLPVIEMLDRGRYTGIEIRSHILEEAKAELAAHADAAAKEPQLVLSEGFPTLGRLGPFDFAWGFSVLIHMTDEIVEECFQFVGRELSSSGVFFANLRIGDGTPDRRTRADFPVVTRPQEFYADLAQAAGLTTVDLGTLRSLGYTIDDGGALHHMLQFARP
jgi:SAM-dependent methyltransferase